MSHGVWFTDNSGWSRWLSNWKKKGEENPYGHFCLHAKLSSSTCLGAVHVGISFCQGNPWVTFAVTCGFFTGQSQLFLTGGCLSLPHPCCPKSGEWSRAPKCLCTSLPAPRASPGMWSPCTWIPSSAPAERHKKRLNSVQLKTHPPIHPISQVTPVADSSENDLGISWGWSDPPLEILFWFPVIQDRGDTFHYSLGRTLGPLTCLIGPLGWFLLKLPIVT